MKICNFRHFGNLNCISMKPEQKKSQYIFSPYLRFRNLFTKMLQNYTNGYQKPPRYGRERLLTNLHSLENLGFATHALHCAFFPALIAITKAHCCTIHPRDTLSGVCPGSRKNLAASALRPTPTRNSAVDLSVHTLRFIPSPV